ncbi:MAG: ABC transporter permease [Crocinitomix sp.]|nr:ABC transporter permease [Crocinitomix sp.]
MMSKVGLIIKREYGARVKKRSFLLITAFVPLLVAGLVFLAMWFSIQEIKQINVLVVDPGNLCHGKVFTGDETNAPAIFSFVQEDVSLDDFQHHETYNGFDLMLGIQAQVITNKGIKGVYREPITPKAEYYIKDKIELRLEEYFALDRGISINEYRQIRQEFNFNLSSIDPDAQDMTYARWVGIVFSTLIFLFIYIYASQVTHGVLEEKTSRIVEILVSSVKPFQLMIGKIIGIGLVGLTQFAIWIVLIGLSLFLMREFIFQDILNPEVLADAMTNAGNLTGDAMSGQSSQIMKDSALIDVIYNGVPWSTLLFLFLIYFIGGYLLFGAIFAIVGAAVDSETDSHQAMLPVQLIVIFIYVIGCFVVFNPSGATAMWLSQIPFTSPFIMLQRISAGAVHYTELLLSLLLLAVTIFVTLKGAAKVYRTGILMYGKKASWKEIFKWLRYSK